MKFFLEFGRMFVYPLVALIYDIGTVKLAGKSSNPGVGELKEQFQKFNPIQVRLFWDFKGSLDKSFLYTIRPKASYNIFANKFTEFFS